ncbi:APC family permease [Nocardia puris]|uniref:APC family permease n=1 Tax=Nocardia puris TaxID=208602 RepID=UPI001894AB7F|nr:APC family permease [Nocardia puris]MBF6212129.1 APC family permease [Nocardia puris]MBF6367155.1 APC family permease [Nocardia puris]MBF6461868.1 APC family permease [Nocardia puris]
MSALTTAIVRSFEPAQHTGGDDSPMRVLGRRQLSGYEVFAQSVATTAPAASMVVVPTMLLAHGAWPSGLSTLVVVLVGTVLAAACIAQFTRRMISPGGLYSFAYQGLGGRGALLTGAAILVKYLASASMTLYHGSTAAVTALAQLGLGSGGTATRFVACLVIAAAVLTALVRGVKLAAMVILGIEVCSLAFIVGLMVFAGGAAEPLTVAAGTGPTSLPFWLTAVFALVGFESATFLGSEAKRPYVTVTRAVVWTPVVCGALFLVAGWAAFTGRANSVVEAYLHGASAGFGDATVILLHTALAFSWVASAMASSNAASRVLFTMGLDGVLPRGLAFVHRSFRTPVAGLLLTVGIVATVAMVMIGGGRAVLLPHLQPAARIGVVTAYLVVGAAALLFLTRIGEITAGVRVVCVAAVVTSSAALGGLVLRDTGRQGFSVCVLVVLVLGAVLWWMWLRRFAPRSLLTIGAFDRADSADVLPGAASYGQDPSGALVLVADRKCPPVP